MTQPTDPAKTGTREKNDLIDTGDSTRGSATPTVDELRNRGAWSSELDHLAGWDPDWSERCARMVNNPWTTGVLPVKWIELICVALNVACTHRNEPGVRRHVRAALRAGATREEILEVFKGVSVLGIHSVAVSLPIMLEEAAIGRRAARAGRHRRHARDRSDEVDRRVQPGVGRGLSSSTRSGWRSSWPWAAICIAASCR